MKIDVILLSGKQGSGKSSLTNALIELIKKEKQSWMGVEAKFADTIYAIHDAARGILKQRGVDIKHETKDGNLLQLLGTEWGRKTLGEDVWVHALKGEMMEKMKSYSSWGFNRLTFIVSDCRFRNEFEAFPEAFRVRLVAEEAVRKARCEMWRENSLHPSEVDLDVYATEKLFDLYVPTDSISLERSAFLILESFKKAPEMMFAIRK